jgi:hypothetical protein
MVSTAHVSKQANYSAVRAHCTCTIEQEAGVYSMMHLLTIIKANLPYVVWKWSRNFCLPKLNPNTYPR